MRPPGKRIIAQQHVALAQERMHLRRLRDVAGVHRRINALEKQPTAMIHRQQEMRGGEAELIPTAGGDAVMLPQRRRVRHRITGGVDDVDAMTLPEVRLVAEVVGLIQLASRRVDDALVNRFDQLHRQARACLAPGGVGEALIGQVMHR